MGLDMFLEAEEYLSEYKEKLKPLINSIIENSSIEFKKFKPKRIYYEVAYWRKANAIHKWFVDNVQAGEDDCEAYYVSLDNLRTLKSVCEKVLADPSLAPELLPTENGFFFGSTQYDDWYIQDLKNTIKFFDDILSDENCERLSLTYRASW